MKPDAPEKIYLHIRPNKEIGSTWHGNKISDNDIEYIRAEAFIEKACKYLEPNVKIILCGDKIDTDKFIKDFKNYMKGE